MPKVLFADRSKRFAAALIALFSNSRAVPKH